MSKHLYLQIQNYRTNIFGSRQFQMDLTVVKKINSS